MHSKLVLTFDRIHRTDEIVHHVEARAAALDPLFGRLAMCRVLLAAEHWSPRNGHRFRTRIDLHVEGEVLVVGADSVEERVHCDLAASIDAAFDTAEHVLRDWSSRRRGEAPPDAGPSRPGVVTRVFRYEGFGVLQGDDGVALPFHRNTVLRGAFENLEVGSSVRFVTESGEAGDRATRVDTSPPKRRAP